MVLLRIIGILLTLVFYKHYSSGGTSSVSYGVQFFRFSFSSNGDESIYSSTLIGYIILIIVNHICFNKSRIRTLSMLLSYMAVASMLHELLRMVLGYGYQFVLILPIIVIPCELYIVFKGRDPELSDNE